MLPVNDLPDLNAGCIAGDTRTRWGDRRNKRDHGRLPKGYVAVICGPISLITNEVTSSSVHRSPWERSEDTGSILFGEVAGSTRRPWPNHDSNYSVKTLARSSIRVRCVIGPELRQARIKAKLSQEELAFRAKLSRNYISLLELEQKSPTLDTLRAICNVLNVRMSAMIAHAERRLGRGTTEVDH